MRGKNAKILTLVLLIAIGTSLIQPVLSPFIAHAQVTDSGTVDDQLRAASRAAGGNLTGTTGNNQEIVQCSWTANWDICFSNIIYVLFVGLGSILAYVGAYFFSFAVQLSLTSAAYSLDFLSQGWTIMRDLANMTFLFILVYIALTIIFRAQTESTVKMLAAVIVVALLVNFSFFFTRVVIDAGNILAVQFYNSIQVTGPPLGTGTKDLAAGIMNAVQIQNLVSTGSFQQFVAGTDATTWGNWWARLIVLSFLYIAVGSMLWLLFLVFLRVGIQFIVRVVVLWLVIIAAPLAFIARALDGTKEWYDTWQEYLIKYSLYPAVFLFLFLILTMFASALSQDGNLMQAVINPLTGAGDAQSTSFIYKIASAVANIAIRLAFIVALLILALKISDKLGGMGASFGQTVTGWATGGLLGATRMMGGGAGGLAYRYGIGRAAYYGAQGLAESRVGNTRVGQLLRKGDTYLANKSFGGVRSYADGVKLRDDREKDKRANLENIQAREDAGKLGELDKKNPHIEEDYRRLKSLEKKTPAELSPAETMQLAELSKNKAAIEQSKAERDTLGKRAENLTEAQVSSLKAADVEKIVQQMSESHLKAVQKSTKYSLQEIGGITKKWHEENKKAPMGKSRDELEKLDKIHDELKELGVKIPSVMERGKQADGSTVIRLSTAKEVKDSYEKERDQWTAKREELRGPERKEAQMRINHLNKAIKKVETAIENLEKVPEEIGGEKAPGTYKVAKKSS